MLGHTAAHRIFLKEVGCISTCQPLDLSYQDRLSQESLFDIWRITVQLAYSLRLSAFVCRADTSSATKRTLTSNRHFPCHKPYAARHSLTKTRHIGKTLTHRGEHGISGTSGWGAKSLSPALKHVVCERVRMQLGWHGDVVLCASRRFVIPFEEAGSAKGGGFVRVTKIKCCVQVSNGGLGSFEV